MEETVIKFIMDHVPYASVILMGLGSLVCLSQVVVLLTPGKADDEAYSKLMGVPILGGFLKALLAFAPIQKK